MAKETGLGWTTWSVDTVDGTLRDIRNPTTSLNFATPRAMQDTTGINVSAIERLPLLADATITSTGVFDDATNSAHDVFKTASSSSVAREANIVVSGQSLFVSPVCTFYITDYALARAQSGEFTYSAPMVLANGLVPTWS